MEFVHTPYIPGRTVAAIATPPGSGGVAIIRISGKEAIATAAKVFSGPVARYASHTVHFGTVHTIQGEKIDDALLIVMKAPRSFTGEDVVEIQCHGGSLVAKKVLQAVIDAGCQPAFPGEFSFKSYSNAKIDLAQAEAIQALIGATNECALVASRSQLEGVLSNKVVTLQKQLTHIAAIFEAWVDFPEEDLEFVPFERVILDLEQIVCDLEALIQSFDQGRVLREGVSIACVGSPNVGKSSLMNALIGKERVIVSPIPGTTRDSVEESIVVNGITIRLIDTAGIRATDEVIEEEGIRRSWKAIEEADIVLYVLDSTREETAVHNELLPKEKTIACWNKIDCQAPPMVSLPFEHVVALSARERKGLDELKKTICDIVWKQGASIQHEIVITSLRHKSALVKAMAFCNAVINGLKRGISAEFVSYDCRAALEELGTIIGTNVNEDILTAVFSSFCIGK